MSAPAEHDFSRHSVHFFYVLEETAGEFLSQLNQLALHRYYSVGLDLKCINEYNDCKVYKSKIFNIMII
jgi:hypothetical protein